MAAAALVLQQDRLHIEEVEQAETVFDDAPGLHGQEFAEEDVEIGSAPAEEKNGALRSRADGFREMVPSAWRKVVGGHGAHDALEKTAVGGCVGKLPAAVVGAHVLDELREVDGGWAALVTEAAGEAGVAPPSRTSWLSARPAMISAATEPGRKRLSGEGQRTGRSALAAILTGEHIVRRHDLLGGLGRALPVRGRNAGRMGLLPILRIRAVKSFRKESSSSGSIGQEVAELHPILSQPQELQDLAGFCGVLHGRDRAAAVAAGAGFAPQQDDAVRAHFKRLEEQRLGDAAAAGDSHHHDLTGECRRAGPAGSDRRRGVPSCTKKGRS